MTTVLGNRTDIEQLQAAAWAIARILGATFSDECWDELSREIADGLGTPPSQQDTLAFNAYGSMRLRVAEIRLSLLIYFMLEDALAVRDTVDLVALDVQHLRSAIGRELCLWPFWTRGC